MISDSWENSTVADVIVFLLNLLFTYVIYVLLTPAILIATGALFLVLIFAVPAIALMVRSMLLYLLALNAADFQMLYAVIAFAFMVIARAAKAVLKHVFKKNAELRFRAKIKAVLIFYTLYFVSALMLLLGATFSGGLEGGTASYIFLFMAFIVSVISMLSVLYVTEHIDKAEQAAISAVERLLQKTD